MPDWSNKVPDRSNKVRDRSNTLPNRSNKVPDRSNTVPDWSNKVPNWSNTVPDRSRKVAVGEYLEKALATDRRSGTLEGEDFCEIRYKVKTTVCVDDLFMNPDLR